MFELNGNHKKAFLCRDADTRVPQWPPEASSAYRVWEISAASTSEEPDRFSGNLT